LKQLVLNATLGWGWTDPIAGLIIAAVAVREACLGEDCCSPSTSRVSRAS
jgi:hypothetical protein